MTAAPPLAAGRAHDRARAAARARLLNAVVREVGTRAPVTCRGPVRIGVPDADTVLVAAVAGWSPSGHHRWADEVAVERRGRRRRAEHDEVVELLLEVVDAAVGEHGAGAGAAALARGIELSVERSARYLAAPPRPEPTDARGRTRHAEQALRLGHPFHPTPKSLEPAPALPLDSDVLDRASPELGASFRLHHLALDPAVTVGERVAPDAWFPDEVAAAAPPGRLLLPVHPLQAAYLRTLSVVGRLLAAGALVDLGPLGREVYATSSVRTVCDPDFTTVWKLPLHLRITNFVRTVPPEHAVRSIDASRAVLALRGGWEHPGFGVLVETGWRGVDPAAVGETAADLTVLFRENPFADGTDAPRVVAGLVEEGPQGEEPPLVADVRRSGLGADAWLRAYLRISLLPLLAIFARDGIGFEAHLQNSLLHTEDGRPTRFWVRDMEGAHVSRERRPAVLAPDSPLVYDEDEAWQRLRYHAVVNHLATVVAVLGHHLGPDDAQEPALWTVVADELATPACGAGPFSAAAPYARDLLAAPVLPAKANLLSRFAGRGETPSYVDLPNPIRARREQEAAP